VTDATARGLAGLGSAVADGLLPRGVVGAVAVDVSATTQPGELAIAGGAALRAADPLRRLGARGRGEPAVALGASPARGHAQSVAGAAEVAAFVADPRRRALGWITKAPALAASGGGAVDQQSAVGWIRGRAPLKSWLACPLNGRPIRGEIQEPDRRRRGSAEVQHVRQHAEGEARPRQRGPLVRGDLTALVHGRGYDKDATRVTAAIAYCTFAAFQLATLVATAKHVHIDDSERAIYVASGLAVFVLVDRLLYANIDDARYRRLFAVFLFASGCLLIYNLQITRARG
jgi:hypothetical protein